MENNKNFSILKNLKKVIIISLSWLEILGITGCSYLKLPFVKPENKETTSSLTKQINTSKLSAVIKIKENNKFQSFTNLVENWEKIPENYNRMIINISPTILIDEIGLPWYKIDSPQSVIFLGEIINYLEPKKEYLKISVEIENNNHIEGYVDFQFLSIADQKKIQQIKQTVDMHILYREMPQPIF